jgi:hypothetical protein
MVAADVTRFLVRRGTGRDLAPSLTPFPVGRIDEQVIAELDPPCPAFLDPARKPFGLVRT